MSVKLTLGTSTAELGPQNPRVLLGRDETKCELWVHDNSVSRRHAEIYLQGGQTYIRDLGSSNGVWVDNNPYDEIPPVRVGGRHRCEGQSKWAATNSGRASALPPRASRAG